jgi:mTERF domain-containing protein
LGELLPGFLAEKWFNMSTTFLRSVMSLLANKRSVHWRWKSGSQQKFHSQFAYGFHADPQSGCVSGHNFVCTLVFALGYPSVVNAAPHLPICSRYSSTPRLFSLQRIWSKSLGRFNHNFSLLAISDAEHDAATDREASLSFLIALGLKEERALKVTQTYPEVLLRTFQENLMPLLQALESTGVGKQPVCRILERNPSLMMRILERNLFEENLEYLIECGLTKGQLERVLRIYPQFLTLSKELNLEPTVAFLLKIGILKGKLGKVISLSPYYLGYRHEITLVPKLQFLLSVGVKKEHLGKIITEQPSILCHSITENITPKMNFMEKLGVERKRIGEIITRYPAIFTTNIETLKQKVEFFENKGLVGKELVNLFTLHPDILGRSLDSLEAGYEVLKSIGFSGSEVCDILKGHPTVLSCTESTVRQKFDFLVNIMNRPAKEVLKFTSFVTYSLEGRIKPRHRVFSWLVSQGLLPQREYALRTIIGGSEKYFRKRFVNLHPLAASVYEGEQGDIQGVSG